MGEPAGSAARLSGGAAYPGRVGPFVRYSLLRLLVLVAIGAAMWVAGARSWLWLLLTALLSLVVSYVFLRGPREAAALALNARVEGRTRSRLGARLDEDAAAEDADDQR